MIAETVRTKPLLRTVLFARGENVSQIKRRSCNRKAKSARWRFHIFRSRTPARLLGPPLRPLLDQAGLARNASGSAGLDGVAGSRRGLALSTVFDIAVDSNESGDYRPARSLAGIKKSAACQRPKRRRAISSTASPRRGRSNSFEKASWRNFQQITPRQHLRLAEQYQSPRITLDTSFIH